MTEIQCPACSALLNIDLSAAAADSRRFSTPAVEVQPSVSEKVPRAETARLAEFNADLADAIREFVSVHPWEGMRTSGDIHAEFLAWCRAAPDSAGLARFASPHPITKNRLSKLLVSEVGADWFKGPGGRRYWLPEKYQPKGEGGDTRAGLSVEAPADVPLTVGGGLVPAAGLDLAGEGSLELSGVASRPLAEHAAAVREQAAAEDSLYAQEQRVRPNTPPSRPAPVVPVSPDEAVRNLVTGLGAVKVGSVDYMFVTKDGVQTKVPLNPAGPLLRNSEEPVVQEEFSPLPDNMVLDGPSVFPVEGGAAPAEPSGSWWVYLTDAEADYSPEELFIVAAERLPVRLVLAGDPVLRFDTEGAPYLQCPVHSTDGEPAGTGEVRVPLPWLKVTPMSQPADAEEVWVDGSVETAEAAAAPLPSSEALAAVAGHDALERARERAHGSAAAVFLATDDYGYEGADPGDWG